MATLTLTDEFLAQASCPANKNRVEFCDLTVPGLLLECRSTLGSTPSWYWRRKVDGKTKYRRLGPMSTLSLADARKAVLTLKAEPSLDQPPLNTPVSITEAPVPADTHPVSASSQEAMTLEAFMTDLYFPHAKVHKRSWMRDEQLYRLRIKDRFGARSLRDITRREVNQFKIALLATGLSKASVNHHVQLLRHVFNLAVNWEILDRNVLTGIELLDLDNQVENYLDESAVSRFLEVAKTDENRNVCMILIFLLSTGARLGEALSAQWAQVDLARRVWKIPATNSKSKKLKYLPLNESAMWVIEQLTSCGSSAYLFPSPVLSGKPYTTITRQWYRIRKKAGIPDNVRIHDLRHTFASRLVSGGRNLYDAQKLLGHADPRTTLRYAHLDMSAMHEASNVAALALA
jgi:integrase